LTDLAKDYRLVDPGLIMGGISFGWLAVRVPSPDCLIRKLEACDFFRPLCEAAAPWGGVCGPCSDFASYTLAFASQQEKSRKNLSQGKRGETYL
jgi:hypothetical protein